MDVGLEYEWREHGQNHKVNMRGMRRGDKPGQAEMHWARHARDMRGICRMHMSNCNACGACFKGMWGTFLGHPQQKFKCCCFKYDSDVSLLEARVC